MTYEAIGRTYSSTRREDPRIAAQVHRGIGPHDSVVNVGAGAGSYEPGGRRVVALEPSPTMIRQRPGRHPVVRGVAESLPFADGSFDVALAVLTVHHWADPATGLRELRRVGRRQLVLYFEHAVSSTFWVMDYFPEVRDVPVEANAPGGAEIAAVLDVREVQTVMVPADCVDGFGAAFWRRPEAYLAPEVQAGMSGLALLDEHTRAAGTARLRDDLASGEWDRRYGHLRDRTTFDGGYRLAVAGS